VVAQERRPLGKLGEAWALPQDVDNWLGVLGRQGDIKMLLRMKSKSMCRRLADPPSSPT
jgi:hypothetical protein